MRARESDEAEACVEDGSLEGGIYKGCVFEGEAEAVRAMQDVYFSYSNT